MTDVAGGELPVDFGPAIASVGLCDGAVTREIYRTTDTNRQDKFRVEPRWVAEFDGANSGDGRLCVRLRASVPGYRKDAFLQLPSEERKKGFDPAAFQVISPLSAIIYLAPVATTADRDAYPWSKPFKIVKQRPSQTEVACFDVPASIASTTPQDLAALATKSMLLVDYEYRTLKENEANCSATVSGRNQASLSNSLAGGGSGVGRDEEVYVSRHQLANAILAGELSIALICRAERNQGELRSIVGDRLKELVPVLLSNLNFQRRSWDEVQKKLVSYSYDGQDAGTKISKHVDKVRTQLKEAHDADRNVQTEGEYVGVAKGKLNAQYKTHDERDELRDIDWVREGEKKVAPTIDVLLLKKGESTITTAISVREISIAEKGTGSRRVAAPIVENGNCAPCSEFRFKAGTTYNYVRDEVACGRIVFEDGARVDVAPNGFLRLDAEEIVVKGSSATIMGKGSKGTPATAGSSRGDFGTNSAQYQQIKGDCCQNKRCSAVDIGGDASSAGAGGRGAEIRLSVTPKGNLEIRNEGGDGGNAAPGGRGKVFRDNANPTAPGNTCEAIAGKDAPQGPAGTPGKKCYEDQPGPDCGAEP